MLLPACLDDYVDENNPVRAIDAFLDVLDLAVFGFHAEAANTGRPGYHPGLMLRIYLYDPRHKPHRHSSNGRSHEGVEHSHSSENRETTIKITSNAV